MKKAAIQATTATLTRNRGSSGAGRTGGEYVLDAPSRPRSRRAFRSAGDALGQGGNATDAAVIEPPSLGHRDAIGMTAAEVVSMRFALGGEVGEPRHGERLAVGEGGHGGRRARRSRAQPGHRATLPIGATRWVDPPIRPGHRPSCPVAWWNEPVAP